MHHQQVAQPPSLLPFKVQTQRLRIPFAIATVSVSGRRGTPGTLVRPKAAENYKTLNGSSERNESGDDERLVGNRFWP